MMNYKINKNIMEITGVFADVEEKSLRRMCQNVYLTFVLELSYAFQKKPIGEKFHVEDYWETRLVGGIMERAVKDEQDTYDLLYDAFHKYAKVDDIETVAIVMGMKEMSDVFFVENGKYVGLILS